MRQLVAASVAFLVVPALVAVPALFVPIEASQNIVICQWQADQLFATAIIDLQDMDKS